MATINKGRYSAAAGADGTVLFLIGMRINRPWKIGSWLPAALAMPRMLRELEAAPPEVGFLGHNGLNMKTIVQYWRSFEHLEAYARSPDHLHYPAWRDFNRSLKTSRGDVGVWHETYKVRAGEFEAVYSSMPPYGLAKAGTMAEIREGSSARERMAQSSVVQHK